MSLWLIGKTDNTISLVNNFPDILKSIYSISQEVIRHWLKLEISTALPNAFKVILKLH